MHFVFHFYSVWEILCRATIFARKFRQIKTAYNHRRIVFVRMNCYKTHGSQCNISFCFQNAPSLIGCVEMYGIIVVIHGREAIHLIDLDEHTAITVLRQIHQLCTVALSHPQIRNYVLLCRCRGVKVRRLNHCGLRELHRFGNRSKTAGKNHDRCHAPTTNLNWPSCCG